AFIYSASYSGPGQPVPSLYKWQAIWFGAGLLVFLVVSLVDYRVFCQWAAVWYTLAIGLLALVLVIGSRVHGAKSWIGIGRLGIQPVEFAKLAVIVATSYYLFHQSAQTKRRWTTVAGGLALVGVPAVLIMAQPDLGSTLVLIPICFGLMFVAGVRVKHL